MASTLQCHATGAPKLMLAKRTKPLPPTSILTPSWPSQLSSSSTSNSTVSWRSRLSPPPSSSPSSKPLVNWALTNNWRSGAPLKSLSTPTTPSFENLLEGQVLFLSNPPPDSIFWKHPQLSAPQDHPVVVVKKYKDKRGEECVRFRLVTSFGGQRLQDKKPRYQWRYFMLCENSEEKPDLGEVAFAKAAPGTGVFTKRCYINLSENSIWEVEYKHLEIFTLQPWLRFDTLSTAEIKKAPAIF